MKNSSPLRRVLFLRSMLSSGNNTGASAIKEKQPVSALRARIRKQSRKTKPVVPSDFMQVVLNGAPAPQVHPALADQVEVFLPDGIRLVITGEKSISMISSILINR